MDKNAQVNMAQDDDEISLWDIVDFLKDGWHWLAGGLAVGLLGAVGFVLVTPAKYEATAIVQPATVGLPAVASISRSTEVEPAAQTLERLKLPTFYNEALLQTCQVSSTQALASTVKASQMKGNALIQVSYRAPSVAVAEACVNAVVVQLAQSQAMIAKPMINTLEAQLTLTRQRLTEAEAFLQAEKRVSHAVDMTSLLILNALSKRGEIAQLQQLLLEQKVQLSAPLTQPLHLLEPIYIPEQPVFPKRLPAVLGGAFGGLVLGGLVFLVRRSWLARKAV